MTLCVAVREQNCIWIVADSLVSGGTLDIRKSEFTPKLELSDDRRLLIAFSGDPIIGAKAARAGVASANPLKAKDILLEAFKDGCIDFLCVYTDGVKPQMLKVTNSNFSEVPAAHIGSTECFGMFQRLKSGDENYVKLSMRTLICGLESDVGRTVARSIDAMLQLSVSGPPPMSKQPRSVGGWAMAYVMTAAGATFVEYCLSVSDPIFNRLIPGSLVPRGTTQLGGFDISVTEPNTNKVFTIYYPQISKGIVYKKCKSGYRLFNLDGTPSLFKEKARDLGLHVDLWYADRNQGNISRVAVMRGEDGKLNSVMAYDGDSLSLAVHNLETKFNAQAVMNLDSQIDSDSGFPFNISMDEDKNKLSFSLKNSVNHIEKLDETQVEALILRLSELRMGMNNPVSEKPRKGSKARVPFNPGWTTNLDIHPLVPGVLLSLRHEGLGWLSFRLPRFEAKNIAKWISAAIPDPPFMQMGTKISQALATSERPCLNGPETRAAPAPAYRAP